MTLPATNITLGAVNTELGNSATAAITLNNPRVRSLGSNLGASGTAFSMSALASKSATWGLGTHSGMNNERAANFIQVICPITDQTCFYTIFYADLDGNIQTQNKKQYINGNLVTTSAAVDTDAFNGGSSTGAGVGPFSTSNIYQVVNGAIADNLVKFNPNGTVLTSARIKGPLNNYASYITNYTNVVVDASENVYVSARAQSSVSPNNSSYYIVALDSSLNIRWARAFPPFTTASTVTAFFVRRFSLDGSGNLYVTYEGYVGAPTSSYVGFVKYNSAGTELLNRALQFNVGSPITTTDSRVGVGASAEIALLTANTPADFTHLTYYNNAGTIQWSRSLYYNDIGGYSLFAKDCIMDGANNIYALVWATGDTTGVVFRSWLVKFNSAGTLLWQRCFTNVYPGANAFEPCPNALILTGNDNLISVSFAGGAVDEYFSSLSPVTMTVKTDGSGTGTYALGGLVTVSYQATPVLTVAAATATAVTGTTPFSVTFTKDPGTAVNAAIAPVSQVLVVI